MLYGLIAENAAADDDVVLASHAEGLGGRERINRFYAIQTDWIIWKTADPTTTKTNRAKSSGETG